MNLKNRNPLSISTKQGINKSYEYIRLANIDQPLRKLHETYDLSG